MLTIGLYLLGQKGLNVLENLYIKYSNEILFVVVGKDENVQSDYSKEIIEFCNNNRLKYYKREEINLPFTTIQFAIGWKWLIPDSQNLIVLHDSLLPKYRGYNPLVTALLNGDEEVGVTAIKANKEYDRGNIVGQIKLKINYPIKIKYVIDEISDLYTELVLTITSKYIESDIKEVIQNESEASYSIWRDEDDYIIDWNNESTFIHRFINSVGYPYKGAKTKFENRFIRILDSEIMTDLNIVNRTPGKIFSIEDGLPIIICGQGLLKIISAVDEDSKQSILFKKLRMKFI